MKLSREYAYKGRFEIDTRDNEWGRAIYKNNTGGTNIMQEIRKDISDYFGFTPDDYSEDLVGEITVTVALTDGTKTIRDVVCDCDLLGGE